MQRQIVIPILTGLLLASCAQKINFGVPSDVGLAATQDVDLPVISTLLVIDNSDSMRDEQETLATGFRNVFDTLHNAEIVPNVDFYLYTTSSLSDYCTRNANDPTDPQARSYCSGKSGDTLSKNAAMAKSTLFSWNYLSSPFQAATAPALELGVGYSKHSGFGLADPVTSNHSVVSIRNGMSDDEFNAARTTLYNSILAIGVDGDSDESALCTMGRFLLEKETKLGIKNGAPMATIIVSDDDEVTARNNSLLSYCVKDTAREDFTNDVVSHTTSDYYKYTAGFEKRTLGVSFTQAQTQKGPIIAAGASPHFLINYGYIQKLVAVKYTSYLDSWKVTYRPNKCAGDNQYRDCTAADNMTLSVDASAVSGLTSSSTDCTTVVRNWLESSEARLKPLYGAGSQDPVIASCAIAYDQASKHDRTTSITPSDSDENIRDGLACDSASNSAMETDRKADDSARKVIAGSCKMYRYVTPATKNGYNGDFANYFITSTNSGASGNCSGSTSNASTTLGKVNSLIDTNNYKMLTKNQGTTSYCHYDVKDPGELYSNNFSLSELGITSTSTTFSASALANSSTASTAAKKFSSDNCGSHTCRFGNFSGATSNASLSNTTGIDVPSALTGACTSAMINAAAAQANAAGSSLSAGSCNYTVTVDSRSCTPTYPTGDLCTDGQSASLLSRCGVDASFSRQACTIGDKVTNADTRKFTSAGTDGAMVLVHKALSDTATNLTDGIAAKIKKDFGARQFFIGAIVNNDKDHATGCQGGDLADKGTGYMDLAATQGSLGYVQSICTADYSPTMAKLEDFIIKRIVPSYSFKAKTEDKIQSITLIRNKQPITITQGVDYVLTKQADSESVVTYKISFLTKGTDDTTVLLKGDTLSVSFIANY